MRVAFQRIAYRVYRLVQGGRTLLERRLTRAGWLVLACLFVTTSIGFPIIEQSVAYQAGAVQGALLAFSWVFSMCRKERWGVSRRLPRYGTVGEVLNYRVRVENPSKRGRGGGVWREEPAGRTLGFEEFIRERTIAMHARGGASRLRLVEDRARLRVGEVALPPAGPGAVVEATGSVIPLRRGVLRFDTVWLARPDPLGLCRSLVRVPLAGSVVVLPRRYALPPLDLPGSPRLQAGGVAHASSVGESEEFVALRDYRRGDPLRKIHWKSWARAGKPVVKEYQDEFFVRHAMVLDTFVRDGGARAFEEAVSVAASFACTIPNQESLLDLLFVANEPVCTTVGRAVAHPEQMLEVLAGVTPASGRPFSSLRDFVVQHARQVCGCVAVLLDWDEPRRDMVRRLEAAGVPVMVLVVKESVADGASSGATPGPGSGRVHWIEAGKAQACLARL